jgi:broad specificity phosphatase PhoE
VAALGLMQSIHPRAVAPLITGILTRCEMPPVSGLAGLTSVKPDPDLMEWDYGGYEGMTATQIRQTRPGWGLWRDGVIPGDACHPGEQLQQVAARTDAVLDRVRPLLNDGDVALVVHGHLLRVLTARWLDHNPSAAWLFRHPDPGTLSALGTEHEQPVISAWNVP